MYISEKFEIYMNIEMAKFCGLCDALIPYRTRTEYLMIANLYKVCKFRYLAKKNC